MNKYLSQNVLFQTQCLSCKDFFRVLNQSKGNLNGTGDFTYLVNGRLHVTKMTEALWKGPGNFRCEILNSKSAPFDLSSAKVKEEPTGPTDRPEPDWYCFIPSLADSGYNFTYESQEKVEIQIRETVDQGDSYYLETLCHTTPDFCGSDFSNVRYLQTL